MDNTPSYGCIHRATPPELLSDERIISHGGYGYDSCDILELLGLKPKEVFYELGSGKAGVLRRAVEQYDVIGVGVELDAELVEESRRNVKAWNLGGRIAIIHGDYIDVPLGKADAVYMFLNRSELKRLKGKLERELKPGARVLSLAFGIPDWRPADYLPVWVDIPVFNDDYPRNAYLYIR